MIERLRLWLGITALDKRLDTLSSKRDRDNERLVQEIVNLQNTVEGLIDEVARLKADITAIQDELTALTAEPDAQKPAPTLRRFARLSRI